MDSEPPSSVSVLIDSPAWLRAVPDAEGLCRRAVTAALSRAGAGGGEVSILLADDATVRELNRRYRGKDRPTNVLSFPTGGPAAAAAVSPQLAAGGGGAAPLGDVALALETVLREAAEAGIDAADHLTHLVVHGTLHLLGHDHGTDAEAAVMESLEAEVLATLGVADPYAEEDPPAATAAAAAGTIR